MDSNLSPSDPQNRWRFRSLERLAQLLEVRRAPRVLVPLLFLLDLVLVTLVSDNQVQLLGFRWIGQNFGLVSQDLIVNLSILALELGVLLLFIRLRPAAVRRDRWQFEKGLLFGLACFDTLLVVLLSAALLTGSNLELGALFDPNSMGRWVAYTIGVALSEEVLYRWFFLGQFFQHLPIAQAKTRLGVALLCSQALFALIHLPTRLNVWGAPLERLPFELFGLFAFGLLYAFVYLQTGSLIAAILAHALVDVVIDLSGSASDPLPRLTVTLAVLGVTALWPLMARGQFKARAPKLAKT